MFHKRRGTILIMSVFAIMLAILIMGFLMDVTRLQIAKHQIRLIADSTALAVVNNWQLASYIYDYSDKYRKVYFIKRSPQDCWLRDSDLNVYHPNSMFPNQQGEAFRDRSSNTEPCLVIDQIAQVYKDLNTSTRPYEMAGFRNISGYQFVPESARVVAVDVREGDDPSVTVTIEAEVELIFGSIFGIKSSKIRESSSTTVQFLTGGN